MFVDEYLNARILGYEFAGTPRFSTGISGVASGSERRNRRWLNPLRRFTSPKGVRCNIDVFELTEMFLVLGGPECTFPFRDPHDFASVRLTAPGKVPTIARTDQELGQGDGVTTTFQLYKTYTWGGRTYARKIVHPVVDSVELGMNGLEPDNGAVPGGPYTWDVDRDTGLLTIDPAPANGVFISAGYLFDVEVRFEADDTLENVVQAFQQNGFSELSFVEIRPCTELTT